MNYDFTSEQLAIKENFSKFCKKELEPRSGILDKASNDEVNKLVKENIKMLANLGYTGMGHEKKYGGTDNDLIAQCIAGEEIAKACASTYLSVGTTAGLFGLPLKLFGTDKQKEKYLPGIISGDIIGGFGLTEPEAGSDAASIQTTAVKEGDKWILNGTKTFITNAPIGDVFSIFAYNDKEKGPAGGVTCFLVDKDTTGFFNR